MDEKPSPPARPKQTDAAEARRADRLKREAAALRANLRKRKAQERARKGAKETN